ncbi:hypothetical protein HAZT_HAZT004413 [Hyalella azteca]|uniref:Uncharacterized protein n=1 Tax=Hyalella azteca TaxID=294128 RepID=A0A6A0GPD3_HYAAZ|nr:hypothetical protein HAZT_HAZT004413 [Hyalella azteca]
MVLIPVVPFEVLEMKMERPVKIVYPRRRIPSIMHFQSEAVRLETYGTKWPSKNVSKEDLARSGFVYSHKTDQVKCFFCKGQIACWEAGDDVDVEHKKSYRNCPLANGKSAVNIPKDGKEFEKINQYILNQLDEAEPPTNRTKYQTDAKAIADKAIPSKFEEFVNKNKRIASFENAPACLPKAAVMAEAGFFYSQFADLAQCYCCGGGIINWASDEDPKAVHDALYPKCALAEKDETHEEEEPVINASGEKRKRKISLEEIKQDLLNFPWIRNVRGIYSDEVIGDALCEDLATYGTLPYTVDQVYEIVDDYESRQ